MGTVTWLPARLTLGSKGFWRLISLETHGKQCFPCKLVFQKIYPMYNCKNRDWHRTQHTHPSQGNSLLFLFHLCHSIPSNEAIIFRFNDSFFRITCVIPPPLHISPSLSHSLRCDYCLCRCASVENHLFFPFKWENSSKALECVKACPSVLGSDWPSAIVWAVCGHL